MIITSKRAHEDLVMGHYYSCKSSHTLPHGPKMHYRRGCPYCFIGFMENARTVNRFTVGGVTKAAYDMVQARQWFFYLYKESTNEG